MGDHFDGFDVSDYGVPKGEGSVPDLSHDTLSVFTDRVIRADQQRTERAIVGAIRAGFDGVDINRPHNMARECPVSRIEPWHYPAPDGNNGFRTERYTWDWFSDDELAEVLTAEDPLAALERGQE